MERSFAKEIENLRLSEGEIFYGEGILAVTKALLQSGVSYVGGYQGAPVSHLIDVMVQAAPYMKELGVHVEPCTSEASAAAMLGASIMYPVRGAVTWKSIVGTNVAADALSNLTSPGVMGGTLIIIGEDYGEGASVIQERSHAYAMKSAIWLMDPRPNLQTIVHCTQKAFELSEASSTPVMMELRIRACHVQGSFVASNNSAPDISMQQLLDEPAPHNYEQLAHPPVIFGHEKRKYEFRMPAARQYIQETKLNEFIDGRMSNVGIVVQGGIYNALIRALTELSLASSSGDPDVPILVLNVVYPLVPDEIVAFAACKEALLVVEESQPEYIEHEIGSILRRHNLQTRLAGKDVLPMAGEYRSEVLVGGLVDFFEKYLPAAHNLLGEHDYLTEVAELKAGAKTLLGAPVPPRPPSFCTGCPERPFFAAVKLAEKDIGKVHYSVDIGCHALATFAPFNFGNSILGYGMSLASNASVASFQSKPPLAVMGDGGFWHNGLLSGVTSRLMNGGDGVLVIMKNGYTSATGTQEVISSPDNELKLSSAEKSATHGETTIEDALKGVGVKWLRTVHTYQVDKMRRTLLDAYSSSFKGLKVIVAEGECQLERQRRIRPIRAKALAKGTRVVRTRFGIDESTCTGDHSCMRLSGCPTLTIKDSSDPLKTDPVAHVTDGCVGCGLCGENAHAATLCPSFWRAEIISNPDWRDRFKAKCNTFLTAGKLSYAGQSNTDSNNTDFSSPDTGSRDVHNKQTGNGKGTNTLPAPVTELTSEPLRILITALGGEGGGTLMNWLVEAARESGFSVQATSVPGVAQRTGATSYYIEVSSSERPAVLNLLPMPGRVDIVLSSELVEAARVIEQGYVSPETTTLIASSSRTYAVAEKIQLDDGRYDTNSIHKAAKQMAMKAILVDLQQLAIDNGTFISATLYGAIAGCGALPWSADRLRKVLEQDSRAAASLAGFDAAVAAVKRPTPLQSTEPRTVDRKTDTETLDGLMQHAAGVLQDYQDAEYAAFYRSRMQSLVTAVDRQDENINEVLMEAARRLANWMAYEDIARVADLKTRPERYAEVRTECGVTAQQLVRISEYLKPRAEEIADILPVAYGEKIMSRTRRGKGFPLLGKGRRIPSSAAWGYWLLRMVASMKKIRRKSLRFHNEQQQIDVWLNALRRTLPRSPEFARVLAELPRVRKGYSDTLMRGLESYKTVFESIVQPAIDNGKEAQSAAALQEALTASFKDEDHKQLNETVVKFHPTISFKTAPDVSTNELSNAQ